MRWAVEGCLAWQEEGLTPPDAVLVATDEYRAESNPLTDWIESECELDPEGFTAASTLRDAYEKWATATHSRKLPGGSKWKTALTRLGCAEERRTVDGTQVRGWAGVRLSGRAAARLEV